MPSALPVLSASSSPSTSPVSRSLCAGLHRWHACRSEREGGRFASAVIRFPLPVPLRHLAVHFPCGWRRHAVSAAVALSIQLAVAVTVPFPCRRRRRDAIGAAIALCIQLALRLCGACQVEHTDAAPWRQPACSPGLSSLCPPSHISAAPASFLLLLLHLPSLQSVSGAASETTSGSASASSSPSQTVTPVSRLLCRCLLAMHERKLGAPTAALLFTCIGSSHAERHWQRLDLRNSFTESIA